MASLEDHNQKLLALICDTVTQWKKMPDSNPNVIRVPLTRPRKLVRPWSSAAAAGADNEHSKKIRVYSSKQEGMLGSDVLHELVAAQKLINDVHSLSLKEAISEERGLNGLLS